SAARAAAAMRTPLGVTPQPTGAYYPAYLDLVRRTLARDYPEKELTEAGLKVYTSLDPHVQAVAQGALDSVLHRLDRTHHVGDERLQGAVVVTAPQTGDVLAVVGGRDGDYDGFNRALYAHRSIGSIVKPFIYLTALETGRYTPATIIEDEPIAVSLGGGRYWRPRNYSRYFSTVRSPRGARARA
ncbi:penicillin-binding protein 1B, partial [mine drainage metagenome]